MRRAAAPARVLAGLLGVGLGLAGCSGPTVDRSALEPAIATTFGELWAQQQALLGHPEVTAVTAQVVAACDRGGPRRADVGAGSDWTCTVVWADAAGRPAAAGYELDVLPDGCYRASGPPTVVGQQQLPLPDGRTALNPIYAFDGCLRG